MTTNAYDMLTTGGDDLAARNPEKAGGVKVDRLFDGPDLRVRAIALDTGGSLPEHVAGVQVLIHVVAGRVGFEIGGETFELAPGALVRADPQTPHTVTALEPSRMVLTLHGALAQSLPNPGIHTR